MRFSKACRSTTYSTVGPAGACASPIVRNAGGGNRKAAARAGRAAGMPGLRSEAGRRIETARAGALQIPNHNPCPYKYVTLPCFPVASRSHGVAGRKSTT